MSIIRRRYNIDVEIKIKNVEVNEDGNSIQKHSRLFAVY